MQGHCDRLPTGTFYRKLRFASSFTSQSPAFLRLYLRVRIRALRPHPPASKDRPKNKRSSGACDRPFPVVERTGHPQAREERTTLFPVPRVRYALGVIASLAGKKRRSLARQKKRSFHKSVIRRRQPPRFSLHVPSFTFYVARFAPYYAPAIICFIVLPKVIMTGWCVIYTDKHRGRVDHPDRGVRRAAVRRCQRKRVKGQIPSHLRRSARSL